MSSDARPIGRDRIRACVLAFAPWLAVYFGVQALGPPSDPLFVDLPFEAGWPVLEWTELFYTSGYLLPPLAPLLAPTRGVLRRFVATGLLATLVVGVLWLAIPVVAVPRPFVPETFWGRLLAAERSWSAHVAAFPSFHTLWALIAADALGSRSRTWAAGAWAWASLVTLSCATTGQHALLDLVAAVLLFVPLRRAGAALAAWTAEAAGSPLLRKWYLDCVSDGGDAAIVYAGRVRLGPLLVPYFELLAFGPRGQRRWRRLCRSTVQPRGGQVLELAAPSLAAWGRWTKASAALDVELLAAREGKVRWRCHQSAGECELRLPDGRSLCGRGYAEELEMSLPPWALPFRQLRWGRFDGGGRSLVWIDWRGGLERRWLFLDAAPVVAERIESDGLAWHGGRLEIEPGVVARDGSIGRTLLGPFGRLLPRRVGRALETKWLGSGRLYVDGTAEPLRGSVLHEVVRWG